MWCSYLCAVRMLMGTQTVATNVMSPPGWQCPKVMTYLRKNLLWFWKFLATAVRIYCEAALNSRIWKLKTIL